MRSAGSVAGGATFALPTRSAPGGIRHLPWGLWSRQIRGILRLEAKKNFMGRRSIPIYLLVLMPVALFGARAVFMRTFIPREQLQEWVRSFGEERVMFAGIFRGFLLRFVIFFGCVGIFTKLFRGEVLDKSLHYYFLVPVRREVLAAGKYLSGLIASFLFFATCTAASMALNFAAYGRSAVVAEVLTGHGLAHLLAYIGIVALACVGYGALFLAVGVLFRNPILPAIVVLGWESLNFLLPPLLKKVSVIYYLQSLLPVPVSEGPFAILAEPASVWIALPLLLALTTVSLCVGAWRLRRMEILYGVE